MNLPDTIPTDSLMRFLQATPHERAAFDRSLLSASGGHRDGDRQGQSDACGDAARLLEVLLRIEKKLDAMQAGIAGAQAEPNIPVNPPEGGKRVQSRPAYVFRWTGRDWEVVFGGGRAFHLPDLLAARYLNYRLHRPNEAVSALDLEVAAIAEKGEARARNSIQRESDARALGEYRQELRRLQAERSEMEAAGELEGLARLEEEVQAIESELSGGGLPDTGERAYDNVRKAFRVLTERLRQGGPEERAFAEHLRTHLSLGLECMYRAPEGQVWA